MLGLNKIWYVGCDGQIESYSPPDPDWYYACGCNDTMIQFECDAMCSSHRRDEIRQWQEGASHD